MCFICVGLTRIHPLLSLFQICSHKAPRAAPSSHTQKARLEYVKRVLCINCVAAVSCGFYFGLAFHIFLLYTVCKMWGFEGNPITKKHKRLHKSWKAPPTCESACPGLVFQNGPPLWPLLVWWQMVAWYRCIARLVQVVLLDGFSIKYHCRWWVDKESS